MKKENENTLSTKNNIRKKHYYNNKRISFLVDNNEDNNKYGQNKTEFKKEKKFNIKISIKRNIIYIVILFFILFIHNTSEKLMNRILQDKVSEVSIIINGTGEQLIMSNNFTYTPDKVYCNENEVNITENKINIDVNQSIIKMVWNTELNNCSKMFQNLNNIIEVNLSKFDASKVTSMKEMFDSCKMLKTVIIGNNFDISNVKTVEKMFFDCVSLESLDSHNLKKSSIEKTVKMFNGCESLESLDLSNFDTSKVIYMDYMFNKCSKLTCLDLSSFNTSLVKSMNYTFAKCSLLSSLDLSNFDTSHVIYMEKLFYGCKKLKFLNISKFNTSSTITLNDMFNQCESLIELDVSNFDTSKVMTMDLMFKGCRNLTYLDLSNFDVSNVKSMKDMFKDCVSIKLLNLSAFNTNMVINMDHMFYNCRSLVSLDLSSFNTSLVNSMDYMFYNCKSLESLNLSNFDISSVTNMTSMFENCSNLIYINFFSFYEKENLNISNIFNNIKDDLIYCINNGTNIFNRFLELGIGECMVNDCSLNWEDNLINRLEEKKSNIEIYNDKCILKNIKIISQEFILTNKIPNISIYSYDINSNLEALKKNYINLTFVEFSSDDIEYIKNQLELKNNDEIYILIVDLPSNDSNTVTSDYYFKFILENGTELNISNIKEDLSIYISVPIRDLNLSNYNYAKYYANLGYDIYDKNSYFYKLICLTENSLNKDICPKNITLCKKGCEYKEANLEDKRIVCKCYLKNKNESIENNYFSIENNEINDMNKCEDENYKYLYKSKCYNKCPDQSHSLLINQYLCEDDYLLCPESQPYESIEMNKCIEECSALDFFSGICRTNIYNEKTKEKMVNNIINEIKNGSLNIFLELIKEGNDDFLIKNYDTIYQLTSTYNQIYKYYEDISTINFGECEKFLKNKYNINENETLMLLKIDNYIPGFSIPIIDYKLFNPETNEELDLNYCSNIDINISIPVSIDENNLFKYDPNSGYYNDKCYTYTTKNGTDITLYDRKNEYNDNNMSLCENNCTFNKYNNETKKAECNCSIKTELSSTIWEEITNNKKDLLNNFFDIQKTANIDIIKCYRNLFVKEGIINNIGFYILSIIILFNLIGLILFWTKGIQILIKEIWEIFHTKNENKNEIIYNRNIDENKSKKKIYKNKSKKNNNKTNQKSEDYLIIKNPPRKRKERTKGTNQSNQINNGHKNNKTSFIFFKINNKRINIFKNANPISNMNKKEKTDKNKSEDIYIDYEINSFDYELALKYDKRTYFQYYISLLRIKHFIIFLFYRKKDYNSIIIKTCFFLFSFALLYAVNALFFNDSTMHKIYEDKGKFNFLYQLPQIIYSTFISSSITFLMKFLSLSDKNIIEIKKEENIISNNVFKIIKKMKIKFVLFFILSFLFLFLFWYYLSIFCAVYINTQLYLIEDTLISLGTSMLYPLGINLVPGIFRIYSLNTEKGDRESIYKISQILQLI